jgi:phosphoglycerate dehydrogenase-like enzyme
VPRTPRWHHYSFRTSEKTRYCRSRTSRRVDEDALIRALREERIRGVALDVFETEPLPPDSPLWDMEDVLVTPHVAGSSPRRDERVADLFARNYELFLAGEFDAFENRIV